jgi:hypothetical protein
MKNYFLVLLLLSLAACEELLNEDTPETPMVKVTSVKGGRVEFAIPTKAELANDTISGQFNYLELDKNTTASGVTFLKFFIDEIVKDDSIPVPYGKTVLVLFYPDVNHKMSGKINGKMFESTFYPLIRVKENLKISVEFDTLIAGK